MLGEVRLGDRPYDLVRHGPENSGPLSAAIPGGLANVRQESVRGGTSGRWLRMVGEPGPPGGSPEGTIAGMSDRAVLITGGTGSFGSTMAAKLLAGDVGEVRILSRDEAKQDEMRHRLDDRRLRFYLGDVRDTSSVEQAVAGHRLRLPRGCAEAGAVLRVLPSGGRAHQRGREQQRDRGLPPCRRAHGGVPEHRQGGLSDQRHGDEQGTDGEDRAGLRPQSPRIGDHGLRDQVRQRHVLPRLGDPRLRCSAQAGLPPHGDRATDDSLPDELGRVRRPGRARLRPRPLGGRAHPQGARRRPSRPWCPR